MVGLARPGDKELLIRVDAIALNLVDSRYSYYPIKTSESRVIGSDLSGSVVELGERDVRSIH
jgi:NADPH:quinone reductase-like Zn-dependent oxidoreductase